jgi:hypothetical protein
VGCSIGTVRIVGTIGRGGRRPSGSIQLKTTVVNGNNTIQTFREIAVRPVLIFHYAGKAKCRKCRILAKIREVSHLYSKITIQISNESILMLRLKYTITLS